MVRKKLRRALGDLEKKPQYIETLPRRGYRPITPVVELSSTVTTSGGPLEQVCADPIPPVEIQPDSVADRLYLEGCRCWYNPASDSLTMALTLFQRAHAMDPKAGRHLAAIAHTYMLLVENKRVVIQNKPFQVLLALVSGTTTNFPNCRRRGRPGLNIL